MRVYKDIYPFNVVDEIKNGNGVYVVDRCTLSIEYANKITAEALISMIESEEKGRYVFYKIEGED